MCISDDWFYQSIYHFKPVEMGLTDLHDSRCVPIVLIKAFIIFL